MRTPHILFIALLCTSCSSQINVSSFDECRDAGYAILESYPMQCRTPDGEVFTQIITQEEQTYQFTSEHLLLSDLAENDVLSSGVITGKARLLFFEGTFPITVYDESGGIILQTFATAESDWMTEEFVPFTATIDLPSNVPQKGSIEFAKDNPSGEPQYDVKITLPVLFQ